MMHNRNAMSEILINELWLAYQDEGKGPPVVLVPGSFADYRVWSHQIGPFSRRHRVIAYSRRYGWPDAPPGQGADGSVIRQVDDLATLIRELGIAPAHIVGHSFGGAIALMLALASPELVRALVLAEPAVRTVLENLPGGEADLKAFQDFSAAMQQAFAAGDPQGILNTFVDAMLPGGVANLPAEIRDMFAANIPAAKVEVRATFSCDDARRILVPALVLAGEQSPQRYLRVARVVADCLAQGSLEIIPSTGHGMPFLNPRRFNEAVLTFVAKH